MCQLSLLKLNKTELNISPVLLTFLLRRNTETSHKDGVGFYFLEKEKYWTFYRDLLAPSENIDFAKEISTELFFSTHPIIAHVRKASYVYKDNTVKEEHIHPFEVVTEKGGIVLAHNGTLFFKDKERNDNSNKEFPGMIDSQIFLEVLGKKYAEQDKPDMVKALQDAMELFYGKFAFLISEVNTGKVFVVRGDSADLHKVTIGMDGKPVGVLYNTEKLTLKKALVDCRQAISLMYPGRILTSSEITEVPKGSINVLTEDGDIEKVGSIVENEKVVYTYTGKAKKGTPPQTKTPARSNVDWSQSNSVKLNLAMAEISKILSSLPGMSLMELDMLLYITVGRSLLELTPMKLQEFCERYLPEFLPYYGGSKRKKKKAEMWRRIKKNTVMAWKPNDLYTIEQFIEAGLQYPFFLTPDDCLYQVDLLSREMRREREKEKE